MGDCPYHLPDSSLSFCFPISPFHCFFLLFRTTLNHVFQKISPLPFRFQEKLRVLGKGRAYFLLLVQGKESEMHEAGKVTVSGVFVLIDLSKLKGSIVPLVTPFDENDTFDEKAFRSLIDWQIESGSHGISVEGTTGEPSSLSLKEREEIFSVTVSAVGGRVPILAGTGTN